MRYCQALQKVEKKVDEVVMNGLFDESPNCCDKSVADANRLSMEAITHLSIPYRFLELNKEDKS